MRAIVNITSGRAAEAAGWRAKDVKVNDKSEAILIDVLKATPLKDGSSMFDLIAEKEKLKSDWALFVDGFPLEGNSNIKRPIKDNVQIHVWDYPFTTVRDA
jgi:hypothetical protein